MSMYLSSTQRGMALAFGGYTAFAFSDVCVKLLTERGYSIFQIITVDTAFASLLLLAFSSKLGGLKSLKDPLNSKIHALRILFNTGTNILLVYCLSFIPIATVYTAVFTKPLLVALMAIPLYRERVGFNRAASIALGLTGVLIAFQPWNEPMDAASLVLLMCATLCIALTFLLSRSLKGSSPLAMSFYPIFGSCVLTSPLMFMHFSPIMGGDLIFFLLSGALVAAAITAVSVAFHKTDSAAVSPMMYTEMIWAVLFGYLVFGDVTSPMMLLGAIIIAASGVYLVFSERQKNNS